MLMLLAVVTMMTAGVQTVSAKSLYVIADHIGDESAATQPVHAYNIGVDGTLTFQAEHPIRHRMLGAVGLAMDSDSGYLFITYEATNEIRLVDGTTMTDIGAVIAEDATDLAGIVYDHGKGLLYCVDRRREKMYVYNWDAKTISLDRVTGSPFNLRKAKAYGIALNEIDGLLYVGNASDTVTVYDTDDWSLVDEIKLEHIAISVALDVMNGYLYTGAGFAGDFYLTQRHLVTGAEVSVQVEPDAGVMGLAVDSDTGLVYVSTGRNNAPGGDNLLVYDTELNQISKSHIGGNPTGIAIPGRDIGFNPFNLTKTLVSGAPKDTAPGEMPSVDAGQTITYGIGFINLNEFTVTDISIVDALPQGVTFVSADDDGVGGHYDSKTHRYEWTYADLPPGSSATLKLTVTVEDDVEDGSIISNSVTINSNETPPTTTRLDVIAVNDSLNLQKTIKGAIPGRVTTVEPGETITYTICFDNYDNDFKVTDVLLIDTLPPEVDFISASKGKGSAYYDQKSHSYIWRPGDMVPGSSACLDLVVRVRSDLLPGTVIRNSAVIDSNESPASVATVDAITSFSGLAISKAIVGNSGDKQTVVGENENIDYVICFENKSTEAATGVTVVDTLPNEVSFVKAANNDGVTGRYDPKTHTYTWSYPSLEPNAKSPTCVELLVQVNKGVAPATTITNSVTISSHETPSVTAINSDAITYYNPLDVRKVVIGGFGGKTEWVDIDDEVFYGIEYTNNNDFTVTNVVITDTLPKEVSFVTADDDGVFGSYDPDSHTYQWVFPSLPAGETAMVELVVHVNPDIKPYTTITNSVTIDSDETMATPTGTTIDVITAEPPVPVKILEIMPDVIRHGGDTYDVQAIMILPEGIGKDDISDVLPILKPGNVRAKRLVILGGETTAKVVAFFDKHEICEKVDAYGYIPMKVKGKFHTGQSFFGEATVYLSRLTGN